MLCFLRERETTSSTGKGRLPTRNRLLRVKSRVFVRPKSLSVSRPPNKILFHLVYLRYSRRRGRRGTPPIDSRPSTRHLTPTSTTQSHTVVRRWPHSSHVLCLTILRLLFFDNVNLRAPQRGHCNKGNQCQFRHDGDNSGGGGGFGSNGGVTSTSAKRGGMGPCRNMQVCADEEADILLRYPSPSPLGKSFFCVPHVRGGTI